jgi:peptide-methionine (S)-S-oxide reductase
MPASRYDASCSLIISPKDFPDPAFDVASREPGEASAVLAGGCFWCVEAVFKRLEGVLSVTSGYAGGTAETADYRTVCSGTTDHAEVIEVRFDPSKTTYGELLKIFFSVAHDPTQLDRQGNDLGRQYRSAVFYADDEQRKVAQAYIEQLDDAGIFDQPIVTTLEPLVEFFEAEEYHQDYADRNPNQPYVAATAAPKVAKLHQNFGDRIVEE